MVTTSSGSRTLTQGHIALYAQDARWRRAMAKSLGKAGHSHQEAASPSEIRRVLDSQRFDVLALKVRDEEDARAVADALEGVTMPLHSIVVGSASALPLTLRARRGGTFRYVPGRITARELSRLVDLSISAGTWEEGATENGTGAQIEEVDMEEAIESAASAVYGQARRKRQRFTTVVEGPVAGVLADRAKLRHALVTVLRLMVTLAPRGALVSVDARASDDEWLIRVRASSEGGPQREPAQIAQSLREETEALSAASRDVQSQNGMLWVELAGPAALAVCLTLPLPAAVAIGRR